MKTPEILKFCRPPYLLGKRGSTSLPRKTSTCQISNVQPGNLTEIWWNNTNATKMMSTNFCTLTKKWFVLRSHWLDCKKKTMPCSVQQPMEDFILQQSPSPHVQELCWRIQSKTPWCLPPQTASRPKTLPKKKPAKSSSYALSRYQSYAPCQHKPPCSAR